MLTSIITALITKFISWLTGKAVGAVQQVEDDKKIDAKALLQAQAVKDAQTKADQDKADTDLLNGH